MIGLEYVNKKITLNTKKVKHVTIVPIGDLHIGSESSMTEFLHQYMRRLPNNAYFILVGDIIENALRTSLGDVYKQMIDPEESIEVAIKFFEPFKDRILGAVSGNHERRTRKLVGLNPMKIIAGALDIPYAEGILVIDLTLDDKNIDKSYNYVISVAHGISSARSIGGKLTANGRFLDVIENADIYITGHVHQPAWTKFTRKVVDKSHKMLVKREGYLVLVPAWIEDEEYVETKLYAPSTNGIVEIDLYATERKILFRLE